MTDADLKKTFESKPYSSVLGAKVVTNPMTGSSKSFGFIRFGDEQERDDALTSMNGAECCGRPIRVAPATKRTSLQGEANRKKDTSLCCCCFFFFFFRCRDDLFMLLQDAGSTCMLHFC